MNKAHNNGEYGVNEARVDDELLNLGAREKRIRTEREEGKDVLFE